MTNQEVIERVRKCQSIVNSLDQDEKCIILMALEKRIPKKPENRTALDEQKKYYDCDVVLCPSCRKRLRLKYKGGYCDKCGQAIDWSE